MNEFNFVTSQLQQITEIVKDLHKKFGTTSLEGNSTDQDTSQENLDNQGRIFTENGWTVDISIRLRK
jgi:hypothetical protein